MSRELPTGLIHDLDLRKATRLHLPVLATRCHRGSLGSGRAGSSRRDRRRHRYRIPGSHGRIRRRPVLRRRKDAGGGAVRVQPPGRCTLNVAGPKLRSPETLLKGRLPRPPRCMVQAVSLIERCSGMLHGLHRRSSAFVSPLSGPRTLGPWERGPPPAASQHQTGHRADADRTMVRGAGGTALDLVVG